MSVGLRSLAIYCTDLEKTREFYEAIGHDLHKIGSEWSVNYYYVGWLENNVDFKILLSGSEKIIKEDNFDGLMQFSVESVVETIKKLDAIGATIRAPHPVMRHACDRAIVEDPDGRRIRLVNKRL